MHDTRWILGIIPLGIIGVYALTMSLYVEPKAIWIDAEEAEAGEMTFHSWYNQVDLTRLSNERWLSHFDNHKPGWARYRITLREEARARLWLRINPVRAKVTLQINDQPAQLLDLSQPIDRENIARNRAVDLRFIAWIDAGEIALQPGDNTLTFTFHSDLHHHGGLDAILLTQGPFHPQGPHRPSYAENLHSHAW